MPHRPRRTEEALEARVTCVKHQEIVGSGARDGESVVRISFQLVDPLHLFLSLDDARLLRRKLTKAIRSIEEDQSDDYSTDND